MNTNNDPQDLWKQNDPRLPQPRATDEICARARRRERENAWARRIGFFALIGFSIAFAHNIWEVDQPWVRLGQGWMLIVIVVYLGVFIRNRTEGRPSGEPCAGFLLRLLETKRTGYLALRRVVILTIPAMFASWWGGGPALKAHAMGLDPSSLYYRYLTGVWPIIATTILLLITWLAFSNAAKKASAECEALRRRIE